MAIIKLGATVIGIRGTLGGITYSANRAGVYAKSWARPPRVRTQQQNLPNAQLSTVSQAWKTITAAQRTAWNTWAAVTAPARYNSLGVQIFLSGHQWFCAMNTIRLQAGQVILAPAPVLAQPAAPTITAIVYTIAPIVQFTYPLNTFLGFYIHMDFARGTSTGQISYARPTFRSFTTTVFFGNNAIVTTQVTTRIGAIQAGQQYWSRIARSNVEGLVGPSTNLLVTST